MALTAKWLSPGHSVSLRVGTEIDQVLMGGGWRVKLIVSLMPGQVCLYQIAK